MSNNNHRGFTLIEMLIALVIFSSAISLVLLGLEQGRQFWFKISDRIAEQGSLYNRELWLAAMFAEANGAYFTSAYAQATPYFMGANDQINFISNAPILGGPGTYAAVMLKFSREGDHYQLQYFEAPNKDPYYGGHHYFAINKPVVLFDNITGYHMRYLAPESEVQLEWAPLEENSQLRESPEWIPRFNSTQEAAMPIMVHMRLEFEEQPYQDWYFNVNRYSNSADPYGQVSAN